jgi:hypothetical protein
MILEALGAAFVLVMWGFGRWLITKAYRRRM